MEKAILNVNNLSFENFTHSRRSHSSALFSHGICPDCARKLYDLDFPHLKNDNDK